MEVEEEALLGKAGDGGSGGSAEEEAAGTDGASAVLSLLPAGLQPRTSTLVLLNGALLGALLAHAIVRQDASLLGRLLWEDSHQRPMAVCMLLLWLWAANLAVWSALRVNLALLCGLRKPPRPAAALRVAALWSASHLAMQLALCGLQPAAAAAGGEAAASAAHSAALQRLLVGRRLAAHTLLLAFLLERVSGDEAATFPSLLWRVVTAPFSATSFVHVLIGDYATSLAPLLADTGRLLCGLYTLGGSCALAGALKIAPLLLRMSQCSRAQLDAPRIRTHSLNFAKYTLSLLATVAPWLLPPTAATLPLALKLAASAYSLLWDVCVDWAFFRAKGDGRLRSDRLLAARWPYYAAPLFDAVLRFIWLLPRLAPAAVAAMPPSSLAFALQACELLRRSVWCFFRVERQWLATAAGKRGDVIASEDAPPARPQIHAV